MLRFKQFGLFQNPSTILEDMLCDGYIPKTRGVLL